LYAASRSASLSAADYGMVTLRRITSLFIAPAFIPTCEGVFAARFQSFALLYDP